jgi:hypothetical protein
MSTLSVRLPNSLHKQLRECARREGTSINQLISSAVAEKLAALLTEDYLAERARRGTRRKFLAALKSAPDVEPEPYDRLPSQPVAARRRTARTARD